MKLSVIIPAHNEEATIGRTLAHTWEQVRPTELFVANVSSTDRTGEIASRSARVLTLETSRGAALNLAAAQASGDVLLFVHADTLLPSAAARLIESELEDPEVVGGAFRLRLDDPRWLARLVSSAVNARSQLLGTFFGDQALFVRGDVFDEVGGYRAWSVMAALEILSRLRRRGRGVLLNAHGRSWARRQRG
jgi:glycosyltransferase involved in cell wall biosynthesis